MSQNNSFVGFINELQNGHCVNELSLLLRDVVAAVKERNASAEIGLKLKIKPRNGGKLVDVEYTITSKMPKQATPSTFFYVGDANTLQRNDPEQRTLDLKEVPKEEAQALRTAAV